MLNEHQSRLWAEYEAAEKDRIPSVYNEAMSAFLESIEGVPMSEWKDWAYEVARRVVDKGESFPVRMPLMNRAIVPALLAGMKANEPGCARWLAGFEVYSFHSEAYRRALLELEMVPTDLLRVAVELDPDDELARHELIRHIASELDFATDTLPVFVLNPGRAAATIDDCRRLQAMLDEMVELIGSRQVDIHTQMLIKECSYHFYRYPEYLWREKEFGSYPDYLKYWENRERAE